MSFDLQEYMRRYRQRPDVKKKRLEQGRCYRRSERGKNAHRKQYRAVIEARRNFVNRIKEGKPCADCRNTFPPVCMDFDHLREKHKSIADMICQRCSEEVILREIEKCDLVCACCHRIRTERRQRC